MHLRSEIFYRRLFNEMLNGYSLCEILYDENASPCDSRFLEVNPAFERLTGLKREQIVGKTAKEVLPGFESFWVLAYGEISLYGRPVYSVNYFRDIDKWLESTAYIPRKDQIVALFTDITEREKTKEENKRLQSQLFQAQKMEAVGRLAGGVAHDFNNLLTAILGYADIALMKMDDKERLKDSLEQIRMVTERAARLTSQLLIFSRREPVELKPQNLTRIVENLFKMLNRILGENIIINFDLDPDIWIAQVNKGQVEQVIMNLAVNARDAMPDGGTLVISTKNVLIDEQYLKSCSYARTGKFVCLSVEDTGIGMDKKTIQQIFEPFYTTKKSGKGTGLGLSVVYGIVKEHRGWINVYSEIGTGSIFKIYLPTGVENTVSERGASVFLTDLRGKGEKILFVEDDKVISKFMKTQLAEKGYAVFTADNVANAIDIFVRKKDIIDLVFTDVVLPDRSGVELINILFSHKPELKVLLTSGYAYKKSEWPTMEERNVRFIQKPYTMVDMFQAIRGCLDNPVR